MSAVEPGSTGPNLLARARALLLAPGRSWTGIEAEASSIPELFRSYVAPLAAIPPVCRMVGVLIFGDGVMGIGLRPPFIVAMAEMLVGYGLTLGAVYVVSRLVDAMAPSFGGARSPLQAFKLVAYSGTAVWAAGVLFLYPPIGELAALLGALYSLYLLYVGLPRLMSAAPEHRISYFAVILLTVLAIGLLLGTITGRVRDLGGPLHVAAAAAYASPT